MNVGGEHPISINGLLSGTISGNVSNKPIKLLPLRIGGSANIYVVGFKANTGYSYAAIDGGQSNLVDSRTTPPSSGYSYTHVDMPLFYQLLPSYRNNLLTLMKKCGTPA